MQLLASCSLEKSEQFNGKLVLPNENKKTPDKVFLNIVVKDGNTEVFKKLSGNEKCVTFVGEPTTFCPTSLEGKVFNETDLDTIINDECYPTDVKGVVTLVRLPSNLKNTKINMRVLKEVCDKYPTVRFIGGNLLGVEGVRIGRYDDGKDKCSPVFKDIYDNFVEVDLEDLDNLQEIVKKTRKRAESQTKEKTKKKPKSAKAKSSTLKEKKVPKRKEAFSKLFSTNEVAF